MIKARNINKTYRIKHKVGRFSREIEYKEAVKNINIEVKPGKIIGLLGLNGAGKTTVIKMLTTMIEPTTGAIQIDGIDAIKNPMKAKEKLNLITGGERNIYWRLTARENLQYFGRLYGISEKELNKRIEEVLKIVNLDKEADTPVEKYSKGMKQRLQIARGLINDPNYIFLDEPTLGLDIVIAKELREYIKRLAKEKNKGILLTTHYIQEAEELCDYIYIINQGEIIAEGKSDELKRLYVNQYMINIELANINEKFLKKIEKLNSKLCVITYNQNTSLLKINSDHDSIKKIVDLINECQCKIINMITLEPSLEDTLLNILGGNYD